MQSSLARFLVRWCAVFAMMLIALGVTFTVFLILADWSFDGAFTTAHQWLNRWTMPFDF